MKVHSLTIDSSQRDPVKYTNPSDYIVSLESPIYDISQIKLVSARIPTPQLLICENNNSFQFKATHQGGSETTLGTTISVGNYTGTGVAALFQSVGGYNFNISYDATKNKFIMGQPTAPNGQNLQFLRFLFKTGQNGYDDSSSEHTTLHQIFGLPAQDIQMIGGDFGAANLDGPNSLVMRISSGSEQLNQTLPTSGQTPYYTGHILLPGGKSFVNVNGTDDKVTHDFHSGTLKSVRDLRIQFFYMSHGRLIPYDFRNQDHVLKFEITCSTDKLENLPKVSHDVVKRVLPPPVSIPEFENPYKWNQILPIVAISFIGVLFLVLTKRKPKLSE
jgi:hypothetical protein|tara:strand:- start:4428 stop:5420 length:993 start_codon:yes stop_codon:yes gene_type:complete